MLQQVWQILWCCWGFLLNPCKYLYLWLLSLLPANMPLQKKIQPVSDLRWILSTVFLENCDVDVVCMHSAVSSLSHPVWLWNAFYWPWGNLIAADVMPCVCFRPADVPHSYHHYYSNPSYHTLSQNRPPLPHLPNNHDRTIKVNVISDI